MRVKGRWWAILPIAICSLAVTGSISREVQDEVSLETLSSFSFTGALGPALEKPSYYEIRSPVRSDGYFYLYDVETPWGFYPVRGSELLRIRLHEFSVLKRCEELSATNEVFKGAMEEVWFTLEAAGQLIMHPVDSIMALPKGVERLFRTTVTRSPKSVRRHGGLRNLVMGEEKRRIAAEMGLDPYSQNEAVHGLLNGLAAKRLAGVLAVQAAKFGVSGTSGVAQITAAIKLPRDMGEMLVVDSPKELYIHNRDRLERMGVQEGVYGPFFDNEHLSPTRQTAIVYHLGRLAGARERGEYVRCCSEADGEAGALFFEKVAEMYAEYHENVCPLYAMGSFAGGVPLATDIDGMLVVMLATDHLFWNERVAGAVRVLEDNAPERECVVWYTRELSPRAEEGIRRPAVRLKRYPADMPRREEEPAAEDLPEKGGEGTRA